MAVAKELLAETSNRSANALTLDRVILFGWYDQGTPTSDSGLDPLVITPQPVGREDYLGRTQGLFADLPLAVQVITISRLEYEETREVIGGTAYPAAKCGRVLNEDT